MLQIAKRIVATQPIILTINIEIGADVASFAWIQRLKGRTSLQVFTAIFCNRCFGVYTFSNRPSFHLQPQHIYRETVDPILNLKKE